jgi:hypothetical protein
VATETEGVVNCLDCSHDYQAHLSDPASGFVCSCGCRFYQPGITVTLSRRAADVVHPLEHGPCTEARLQSIILHRLQALRDAGYPVFAWRANSGVAVAEATATTSKRVMRAGLPGQADVLGCVAGRFVGIEVKSASGRTRPAQVTWREHLERAGGLYVLARTLTEALQPILTQLDGVSP